MKQFKQIISMFLVIVMVMSLLPLSVIAEDIHNTHTVQFKLNYNGAHKIPSQKVTDGECAVQPEDVTREGWIFEYWYVKTGDNGIQKFDLSQPITEDVTLYARWDEDIEYWGPIWNRNILGAIEDGKEDEENSDGFYTVTFEANADGVVGMPESQKVAAGECANVPSLPEKDGYLFLAWYINKNETDYSNFFDFENTIIDKNTTLYAIWVNIELDTDKDGLPDTVEDKIGTNINKIDSDDDGLSDYIEVMQLGTNPTLKDTDSNGIDDADEDHDGDGISNIDEVRCGTSPVMEDSDMDGLKDNEEIQLGTDPMNADSDTDGADDGIEIEYGFNPLVANDSFIDSDEAQEISEFFPVTASVEAEVCGKVLGTVAVNPLTYIDNPFISKTIPGYMGYAFEFTAADEIISATLTFEYDTALGEIGDDFQPRVYYFNPETQGLEELPDQTVTRGRIVVATEHFSTYVMLNKVEYDARYDNIPCVYSAKMSTDVRDYYEDIKNGTISFVGGANILAGYDFSISNDFDKDGLPNDQEIFVRINQMGIAEIYMKSNPVFSDSDFDGISDKEDSDPTTYSFRSSSVDGLLSDNRYPPTLVYDDLDENIIHSMFTSTGTSTYGTLREICRREWLEYFNYYSEGILRQYIERETYYSLVESVCSAYDTVNSKIVGTFNDSLGVFAGSLDDMLSTREAIRTNLTFAANDLIQNTPELIEEYGDETVDLFKNLLGKSYLKNENSIKITVKCKDGTISFQNKINSVTDSKVMKVFDTAILLADGAIKLLSVIDLYANANANVAAMQTTIDLFYKIQENAIIEGKTLFAEAAVDILNVLEENYDTTFKDFDTFRNKDLALATSSIAGAWAIGELIKKIPNPYVKLITTAVQIIITLGSNQAYNNNRIIASSYLAENIVHLIEPNITHKNNITQYYCNNIDNKSEILYYMTHLAHMRIVSEIRYDEINNNKDWIVNQVEKIIKHCDNLNIYINKSLLIKYGSITSPNINVKVYQFDFLPVLMPPTGDQIIPDSALKCSPSAFTTIYVDGERINRTTNIIGYSQLRLEPGESYTITIQAEDTNYSECSYDIYVEDSQKYNLEFLLFNNNIYHNETVSCHVTDRETKAAVKGAYIKIREGFGKKEGEYYSTSSDIFTDNAGVARVALPVGCYTFEITADNYQTEYIDVKVVGNYLMSDILGEYYDSMPLSYSAQLREEKTYTVNVSVYDDITKNLITNEMTVSIPTLGLSGKTVGGKITFTKVPLGVYNMTVSGVEYPTQTFYDNIVNGNESIKLYITKDEIPTYKVSGIVTTDRTPPTPIKGVTVSIANTMARSAQFPTVTTADDGTYSFNVPNGTYTLTFTKANYKTQTAEVTVQDGDETVKTITMPLSNVDFTIKHINNGVTTDILTASPIEMYNGVASMTWTINSNAPWKIVTNRGDWFSLSVDGKSVGLNSTFDAGETELKLNITKYTDSRNDGTIAFEVGGETHTVKIFQEASHLKGWIVAGLNQPIEGAVVTVSNGEKSWNYTTGANGVFDITVPNAFFTISVTAAGYESKTYDRDVQVNGEDVDIGEILLTKSSMASLTGTIRDGDADSPTYGQVLEGVSLDVYDSTGKKVGDTAKSNENGVVAFAFPAAGTYKLVFSLVGYETVTVDTVIINENTPSLGQYVMMRTESTTSVSGTTTPGTKLELLDENGNVLAETIADENGNYDFGNIPGWDGTIFRIRIKDTTVTVDVVGGATGVVVDTTVTIFTVSTPDTVQIGNEVGAISEWEIESSHPWTVTKSGDTSWYTLNMESGNAGITDFVVTATGTTDSYRESTLTFALNNRTFEVTIYQNFVQTVSGIVVEKTENSDEVGIENIEIVVRKADDSSWYSQTETDANGQYTLFFEDTGEYVITYSHPRYYTVTVEDIVITADSIAFDAVEMVAKGIIDSGECGDDITWTLYDDYTLIVSGTGDMWDYHYESDKLSPWGSYRDKITSIVIEEGITGIGEFAFYYCENVDGTITVPNGVTAIEKCAFEGCKKVDAYNLPYTLNLLGGFVFKDNVELSYIYIPDGVTDIGERAFYHCNNLNYIYLPEGIKSIGDCAFVNCFELRDIYLPESLEIIGIQAFWHASLTGTVNIPARVSSIGWGAFYGECITSIVVDSANIHYRSVDGVLYNYAMTELIQYPRGKQGESYTVPYGVTKIWRNGMAQNGNKTVILPDTLREIGYHAFWNTPLTSICIPSSVEKIDSEVFAYSYSLKGIYFCGDVPASFGNNIVANCSGDLKLYYLFGKSGWTSPTWKGPDGTLYNTEEVDSIIIASGKCGTNIEWTLDILGTLTLSGTGTTYDYGTGSGVADQPWYTLRDKINRIVISHGITGLGWYNFERCDNLTEVQLPNSLTNLGKGTFVACGNLTKISIPDSVTFIGWDVFYDCKKLSEVQLSNNLQHIGWHAFYGCSSLEKISIPSAVTEIGKNCFLNCTRLKKVYFYGSVPTFVSGEFHNTDSNLILYYISGKSGWTSPTWAAPDGTVYYTATWDPENTN